MKKCTQCGATYPDSSLFCQAHGATLVAMTGLTAGAIVRRKYRIEREIGRGGMGAVYQATHLLLREDRALKIINREYASQPEFVGRFLAEALITRQISHPNIVRVEDADETEDGQPFVVMEYVAGESVRSMIQRDGCIEPALALRIATQVCEALSAAHRRGIIHRDIKPDNILVVSSSDGREIVKVVDFGIAKVRSDVHPGLSGVATQTGYFWGSPKYCSPEQARGEKSDLLDGRTDIYSLGIVLYEMLTGKPPFEAETPIGILQQQIESAPPDPRLARPDLEIPEAVAEAIKQALQKDRVARFASAETMLTALKQSGPSLLRDSASFPRDEAKPAAFSASKRSTPEPGAKRRKRKHAWIYAGMGVSFLLLLVLLAAALFELHFRRADRYRESGAIHDAEVEYRKAIMIYPINDKAHLGLAWVLDMENSPDAEKEYREVERLARKYGSLADLLEHVRCGSCTEEGLANLLERRALAFELQKKNSEAETYYREVFDVSPSETQRSHYGQFLEKQSRKAEAENVYREMARTLPQGEAHRFLGDRLLDLGKTNEAVAEYLEAVHVDPSPDTRKYIADRLSSLGRKSEAASLAPGADYRQQ